VPNPVPPKRAHCFIRRSSVNSGIGLIAGVLMLWLAATGLPLWAAGTMTMGPATAVSGENFGQYLADHQADLEPFFEKNAKDILSLAVPALLGMLAWVVVITMVVGWVLDVGMSRGFAYFFAPAFAEWKRCIIYATGKLFLSFVYACLVGIVIVFGLKLTSAVILLSLALLFLLVVGLAAQIVWIIYLYRTNFVVAGVFFLAIMAVQAIVFGLVAKPVIGMQATSVATNFVDQAITPKLQAEADTVKHDLAEAQSARDAAKAKVDELQSQIDAAQNEQAQLAKEIEEKKNSDVYLFSLIVQVRARGELAAAREQLTGFLARFPTSSLHDLARAQLAQISDQMAADETKRKQEEADAARAAAQARADLLARAAKGEATLSEMRQVLIGKSRADVSNLLGLPTETGSDSWGYSRQMILNPLTNEKHGLTVYFSEGAVQGVDYDRSGGAP